MIYIKSWPSSQILIALRLIRRSSFNFSKSALSIKSLLLEIKSCFGLPPSKGLHVKTLTPHFLFPCLRLTVPNKSTNPLIDDTISSNCPACSLHNSSSSRMLEFKSLILPNSLADLPKNFIPMSLEADSSLFCTRTSFGLMSEFD